MLKNSTNLFVVAILLCALMVTPAQAVSQRAYVASYGNDLNTATDCYITAPCRTFAQAVTVVLENGEVLALDSTGYGPVTLSKSISLTAAPGVYAGMSVFPGVTGIKINNPATNVVLRGLTINGQGGDNGIWMNSSGNLSIENCVISNFWGYPRRGILVTQAAKVRMVNTLVRNTDTGIELQEGATAMISKSKFLGNDFGIFANGAASTTTATVRDSVVTGSRQGIVAYSQTVSANNRINVIRSTISNNNNIIGNIGVSAQADFGTALITLSKSLVAGNYWGFYISAPPGTSASVLSFGNNTVIDNTIPTNEPTTPIAPL